MIRSSKTFLVQLLFLSASGTWFAWLVIGPIFSSYTSSLVSFGLLALIRQLLSLVGTTIVEFFEIEHQIVKHNITFEILQIIVNIFAFLMLYYTGIGNWIFIWAGIRFLFSGASISLIYRLLLPSLSASKSVLSQLSINQGSIIFGAFLSLFVSTSTRETAIFWALLGDTITSVILLLYLNVTAEMPGAKNVGTQKSFKLIFVDSLKVIDLQKLIGFFLGLIAVSALPSLYIGIGTKFNNSSLVYSILNALNGFFFLAGGLLLTRIQAHHISKYSLLSLSGIVFIVGLCISFYVSKLYLIFLGAILIAAGAIIYLLVIHQIILSNIEVDSAARIRAALGAYLAIIFGVSEYLTSLLLSSNSVYEITLLRTMALLISILCLLKSNEKKCTI